MGTRNYRLVFLHDEGQLNGKILTNVIRFGGWRSSQLIEQTNVAYALIASKHETNYSLCKMTPWQRGGEGVGT